MSDPILAARIYIVDDQAANLRLLERYLGRAGFGDVTSFTDPRAALAAIEADEPDLLLLDLHMPGLDGFGVLDALREKLVADAFLPVLVLTGDVDRDARSRALAAGATDFLTNPLDAQEFVLRARNLIRTRQLHEIVRARNAALSGEVKAVAQALAETQEIGELGTGEWDLKADRMHWSNGALRLFGVDAERVAHIADFLALVAPDDRASVLTGFRAARDTGRAFKLRHKLVRGDGEVRIFISHAELVRDADGTPVRMVGTVQDITDRMQVESALRRSEHLLAEAQRISHIGSWEFDFATRTALRSEETQRIFGVEPGTFPGTVEALLAFVHPDDRLRVRQFEELAASEGGRHGLDYRIIRPDGIVRLVHEEVEAIRDSSGKPVSLVGTVQDVTDRVAAEGERARLASAIEQTADSIWMQDLDNVVTYVNRSFSRVYGYEPDEIVGRHAGITDSGHHEPSFFTELWASVAAGRTWTGSLINRRKDGTLIEVEAVISGIRDTAGQVTSYIQTDRDVTRERALEGALERDARERETIEAALERIDPEGTPEAIAAAACAEIVGLPEVDSAWAIGLGSDYGRILAEAGLVARVLRAGTSIPDARADYLRERAARGPWAEAWRARPEDGTHGETISATGLHTAVYAPLRGAHGVVGLIGFGAHDPANAERIVERLPALATFGSIVGSLIAPALETRHREADARATIAATIAAGAYTPFFQPIADLHTGKVVGYEALSRFTDGTPPDVLFGLADRAGIGLELETATLAAALDAAAVLPPTAYLSLNVSPALIVSGALGPMLAGHARPIALEITEHVLVEDYPALRAALTALGPDVHLAVDDAGAGYASLRHILELAPNYVKLDIGLVRGIDADPARQALIAGMTYFAVKRKVRLVAEGIETTAELETLRKLAIPYGQGYLLGRPQDGRGPGPWPAKVALHKR